MDYSFLDKEEYKDIPIIKILDNNNNLPFFIIKMDRCNDRKHRHEFVQIIYVCKGKLKHVINDHQFDVYKGDIFVIPPYVPHYFIDEYKDDFEIIEFEFMPEFINEKFSLQTDDKGFMDFAYLEPFLVAERQMRPRLNLTGSLQSEAEKIFQELLMEYKYRQSGFILMTKALLLRLLVLVGREYKKAITSPETQSIYEKHRDALSDAIMYVDKHYVENLSTEDVARHAMMSPSYFRYLFKQMTGKTLVEYINSIRISKASELLRTSPDIRIIDICYQIGYNNVNYFNKMFRRETGISPSQYRKKTLL